MRNTEVGCSAVVTTHALVRLKEEKQPHELTPRDCARWQSCNAALCPLQPGAGIHVDGDRICFYIAQVAKEAELPDPTLNGGVETAEEGGRNRAILLQARQVLPELLASAGAPFRKAVKRAGRYGSSSDRITAARAALARKNE